MDDRMDMDPPSPPRPPLQSQQEAFQSACPAMRASNYQAAPNVSLGRYDPVHSAMDSSWNHDQWQAPPFSHSFSAQRLSQATTTALGTYPNMYSSPGLQDQAAFQHRVNHGNHLPFGYQVPDYTAPQLGGPTIMPGPFGPPLSPGPSSFARQGGSNGGGLSSGGRPGLPGTQQQHAHLMHYAGTEHATNQPHHHSSVFPGPYDPYGASGLRPPGAPPTVPHVSSSAQHNFAGTWQPHWIRSQGYPYLANQPYRGSSHPQPASRAPQSFRRHRSSMPRSATVTNSDLDSSPSPSSQHSQSSDYDDHLRTAQTFRGSLVTKKVASGRAVKSLEHVLIADLPEEERTCNICYNDFGVETPEKITETPVRIPGCKHLFGHRCIKTWFEDSNLCPYCREAVDSELRSYLPPGTQAAAAAHGGLRDMFQRNDQLLQRAYSDPELVNELLAGRVHARHLHGDPSSHVHQHQQRRAPPTNSEEGHRRQRPRHGTWVPVPHIPPQPSSDRSRDSATSSQQELPPSTGQGRSTTPAESIQSGAFAEASSARISTGSNAGRILPPVNALTQYRQRLGESSSSAVPRDATRNDGDRAGYGSGPE